MLQAALTTLRASHPFVDGHSHVRRPRGLELLPNRSSHKQSNSTLALFAAVGLAACQANVVAVPTPVATSGPAGPQGATGSQGNSGGTGAQGSEGAPGATGATDATGNQGSDGVKGDKGKMGDATALIVIPGAASSPSN